MRTPRFLRKRSTRGSQEAEPLPGPHTPSRADHRTPAQGGVESPNAPPQATRRPLLSQQQESKPAPGPKRPSLPLAVEAQLVRLTSKCCLGHETLLVVGVHGRLHPGCGAVVACIAHGSGHVSPAERP